MLLRNCYMLGSTADACLQAVEDIEQARLASVRLGSARLGLSLTISGGWVDDCYQWTMRTDEDGFVFTLNQPGEREDSAAIAVRLTALVAAAYPLAQVERLP